MNDQLQSPQSHLEKGERVHHVCDPLKTPMTVVRRYWWVGGWKIHAIDDLNGHTRDWEQYFKKID